MPCLQKKDFITNCIIVSKSRGLGSFPGPFCMVNSRWSKKEYKRKFYFEMKRHKVNSKREMKMNYICGN